MARIVRNRSGKQVTLLNPSERGRKFLSELKTKTKQTVDGVTKVDEKGKPIRLKEREIGYRVGYLAAQKESAKIFNSKKKKKNKK